MNRTVICVFGIAAYLGAVQCVFGDGVIRDGLGACSIGRGGTNIAFADNGEILLDNPAGMVNVEGCGLVDLGIDLLFTDLQYSDPQNTRTSASHDPLPIPQASVVWKSADEQWAFGLGVFAPAGLSANWELEGPAMLPGQQNYKTLGAMAKFLPGVAYCVDDRLLVGATLGLGLSHTELQGPYFLQSPGPFQGTPMIMQIFTTGVALTWSAGLQYQLTDATTVGATYQSASYYAQTGHADINVPALGASNFDAEFDMAWPQSVGLGIRHELCPHRILSADVIWLNWSSAFNRFDLRLSNPSNPMYAALLGPSLAEQFPLDWHDSVSLRFGYEQRLEGGGVIRAGYVYHANPIPSGTLTPFIPATLENAFSLGYGWRWGDCDVNLAYQYSFGPEISVVHSDLVGGNFNNSWEWSQAHWIALSLMRRF